MCGINGIVSLTKKTIPDIAQRLQFMNSLIKHRGPDGDGIWFNSNKTIGLGHTRLSIIDLSSDAKQPMLSRKGHALTFNGEIYNFKELQKEQRLEWDFTTESDSETILSSYAKYNTLCLNKLQGMFSFAIADNDTVFAVRDRFGIKPFYYAIIEDVFYFSSEAKAITPFIKNLRMNLSALSEYFVFQTPISDITMFNDIKQLSPGHYITISNGDISIKQYWDLKYQVDFDHSPQYFSNKLEHLFDEAIDLHLRSDVPLGCYLSGGIDSSLISLLSSDKLSNPLPLFHGRFNDGPEYDESYYAQLVQKQSDGSLYTKDITHDDFLNNIEKIIYYLDFPIAGPGVFPQYMVSEMAHQHVKVALGGQGGDEIFGGYARYLIAYFEQCITAAIDGTHKDGNFVVTPESIIPNLSMLKAYKPMLKNFWEDGLFDSLDKRYLRLVDRSVDIQREINWDLLDKEHAYSEFYKLFNCFENITQGAYIDRMIRFDLKTLLPALLHVEDRVSMAHGLESRVPMLHHPLVEFVATIPPVNKFQGGKMKNFLINTFDKILPTEISQRKDKMGFPVPLNDWSKGPLRDFFMDVLNTGKSKKRGIINYSTAIEELNNNSKYSRKTWAFICFELWQHTFFDNRVLYKANASQNEYA